MLQTQHEINDCTSIQNLVIPNPMISQMKNVKYLGKGGFGTVNLVRSQLDDRLIALKKIPFRSKIPPWTLINIDELDEDQKKDYLSILRELKALSAYLKNYGNMYQNKQHLSNKWYHILKVDRLLVKYLTLRVNGKY
jgi:serine/threonine protein kinase